MATKLVKDYTKALVDTLNQGVAVETALTNLKQYLKQRGHEQIWSNILQETLIKLEKESHTGKVLVRVAKAEAVDSPEVKDLLNKHAENVEHEVEIDETLIGGAVITHQHRRLDTSYKTKLINLYHGITTR